MIIDFLNFLSILKTFLIQNDSAILITVVPERKSNFFPKLKVVRVCFLKWQPCHFPVMAIRSVVSQFTYSTDFNTISKPILSGVRKAESGGPNK